eukprot:NODE_6084_length_292_cov_179.098765_g5472_i0.p1 GENE.NODE_6084_length_292_cov_179.098765_g5472_i0~~NODE_6084_length_292_cov_179.098765_g5472_i0.p1  ORF type:complete len:58 (-),score=23.64 NODE_6084_length_292_cov_179.098765_g5472_i0:118-261(-)
MGGAVLVQVTGLVKTDDDPPHSFAQTFMLFPEGGNYWIAHDVFRIVN